MKNNMKTTGKMLALGCGILVALASCTKGDVNDDLSGGGNLLLVESKIDGKTRARYEYDGQNKLAKLYTHDEAGVHTATVTYLYSDDLLSFVEMINVSDDIEYTESYTYGSDNRPISSKTIFDPQDAENAINTTYSYPENKVIEKAVVPGGYTSEVTYTMDDKGNLLAIETSAEGQWASTTTYGDYDNKHAAGRHGNPYRWKFNSPNNHRSEKTTSTYDGGNLERTLKYTYNNEGYPIKMEVYPNDSETVAETHEYVYKKAN